MRPREHGAPAARRTRGAYARLAGFMYLATIAAYLAGGFVAAHAGARPGLALTLATSWATVLLAGALYALLRAAGPLLALVALLWRAGEAVLGAAAVILRYVALDIARDPGAAMLARTVRTAYATTYDVTILFFCAGSTIFFGLMFRARSVPRAIAGFGAAASILYAGLAAANLTGLRSSWFSAYGWQPILAAELVTGLWLCVAGAGVTSATAS